MKLKNAGYNSLVMSDIEMTVGKPTVIGDSKTFDEIAGILKDVGLVIIDALINETATREAGTGYKLVDVDTVKVVAETHEYLISKHSNDTTSITASARS